MIKINTQGCTRIVILTKRYAIKIPRITTWEGFLLGCLGNLNESRWKDVPKNFFLCPILYANRFGLINIMPRCSPIKNTGLYFTELERICVLSPCDREFYLSDAKPENFGIYQGQMVKLDYGS